MVSAASAVRGLRQVTLRSGGINAMRSPALRLPGGGIASSVAGIESAVYPPAFLAAFPQSLEALSATISHAAATPQSAAWESVSDNVPATLAEGDLAVDAALGDELALSTLAAQAADSDASVRRAAVEALAAAALRGEATALAAVVARLQDGCLDVKRAALDLLARVADCGDDDAIATASGFLEQQNLGLRWRSDALTAAAAYFNCRIAA